MTSDSSNHPDEMNKQQMRTILLITLDVIRDFAKEGDEEERALMRKRLGLECPKETPDDGLEIR